MTGGRDRTPQPDDPSGTADMLQEEASVASRPTNPYARHARPGHSDQPNEKGTIVRGWIEDRTGRGGLRWRGRHRGADGRLRSRSFRRKIDAQAWLDEQRSKVRTGSWIDPDAGKLTFSQRFERLAGKHRITERTRFDYRGIYR